MNIAQYSCEYIAIGAAIAKSKANTSVSLELTSHRARNDMKL